MKFASPEYMEEVKKRSNSDAEYLKLAEGATGSYTMQILAEPDKGVPNDIIVGYEEVDGKIGESWQEKHDTYLRSRKAYSARYLSGGSGSRRTSQKRRRSWRASWPIG